MGEPQDECNISSPWSLYSARPATSRISGKNDFGLDLMVIVAVRARVRVLLEFGPVLSMIEWCQRINELLL